MTSFLGITLEAPLAAWGEVAVGEARHTQDHPTRSALLGLLGAALGLRRDAYAERTALAKAVGFAIRVDRAGQIMEDYHTTQVPPDRRSSVFRSRREELANDALNTVLSTRQYCADGAWTVLVWGHRVSPSLGDIETALRRPHFALYLGRKSCPLGAPLRAQRVEAHTLAGGFAAYDESIASPIDTDQERRGGRHCYWEVLPDGLEIGLHQTGSVERRDEPMVADGWNFARRTEWFGTLEPAGTEEGHK